jgi:D-3-phosphoglycerate dehydrogenase
MAMSRKVLVSDDLSDRGIEVFQKTEGIEVDVQTSLSYEEFKAVIKDYHGLAIRSATKVTADIIDASENLEVIGRAGIGLDNVDIEAATKKGIVVMNTPEGNAITTAEHTIAMMMALVRNIPQANASLKSGKWEKKKFMGNEVFNKTLGVIGIGRVGRIVADRAKGLKMNVIAYDPFISPETVSKLGIETVDFDELLSKADIITIHAPKTPETLNFIDAKAFKRMRDGVIIINCARGGIVNEKDLLEAIRSEKVAGAALDVFEKEPPGQTPLFELEQVICTPHLGASTEEAQVNVALTVAEQITDFLLHGTIRNAVNVSSVSAEILSSISPYIKLAEKLGLLIGQLISGALREVSVEYSGEVTQNGVAPITVAMLKGILSPILSGNINYVNAPVLARERGIKVMESISQDQENYTNLITIRAKHGREETSVAGALFGKHNPRILRLDNFLIEAVPEGHILLLYNYDKPGVIGNIGTTLWKNNINIGMMQFGRDQEGGIAVSLLHLDHPIPKEVLNQIMELPNIISTRLIEL